VIESKTATSAEKMLCDEKCGRSKPQMLCDGEN